MHSNKILHYVSPGPETLWDVLTLKLGLSEDRSRELFELGSLYFNKIRTYDLGQQMAAGDYVRIHSAPRRFPRPSDLGTRLLAETEDWVIVDKPSGIPCHATVDNAQENFQVWMGRELGYPLHITHRLDVPTSGCMVYGKNLQGVRSFNKLLIADRVAKEYEVLVQGRLERTGLVTHWMKKDNWAPREVYNEEREETQHCALEIVENEDLGSITRLRLKLLTGRTHQIRVQMQALGHPVLNDVMYGALRLFDEEKISLKACKLSIHQEPGQYAIYEAPVDWSEWLHRNL